MFAIANYFANPADHAYDEQAMMQEEAMISPRHPEVQSRSARVEGCFQPTPGSYSRARRSHRSSYPPSNREIEDYESAMAQLCDNGISGSNCAEPVDSCPRPRRSSLRKPGMRRRNTTPPKRVRFDTENMGYWKYQKPGTQQVQELLQDQILGLLGIDHRKWCRPRIPRESCHSVEVFDMQAGHEYPEPVSHAKHGSSGAPSMRAEVVDYARELDPRRRSRANSLPSHPERPSTGERAYSRHHEYQERGRPARSLSRSYSHSMGNHVRSSSREDIQSPPSTARTPPRLTSEALAEHEHLLNRQPERTSRLQKRYSASHYETTSQRQARGHSQYESRPRAGTAPAATQSNRSSLDTDDTLANPEMTWAPAAAVLAKPPVQVDENMPICVNSKEGTGLRRKDARRLPESPRRSKILDNLGRFFA